MNAYLIQRLMVDTDRQVSVVSFLDKSGTSTPTPKDRRLRWREGRTRTKSLDPCTRQLVSLPTELPSVSNFVISNTCSRVQTDIGSVQNIELEIRKRNSRCPRI